MAPTFDNSADPFAQVEQEELDDMLYAQHAEIKTKEDLEKQRGTPIPALFNQFYRFIQNPSTVSVETYKRMVDTDDTIGSAVDFIVTCLCARLGRYQHKSNEVTQWVNKALEKMDGGFSGAVKEALSAIWAGFSLQEMVWANTEEGFIVKKLVTLPPSTILFETERTGEITKDGILQFQRNYNPALIGTGAPYLFGFTAPLLSNNQVAYRPDAFAKLGDLPFPIRTGNLYNYLAIRIPREKCLHYAFDAQGKFGNPYGRSRLRRVYKYSIMKDAFLQMLAIALDRKGTPLTVIFADPNTTVGDQTKVQQGQSMRDKKVGIRADMAVNEAMRNIHNDSYIILPGKKGQVYDLDFMPQTSNATDFIGAVELCNKGIMRGLLIPSLIMSAGDGGGAYALGQEHAKTFDKILDGDLATFKQCLLDDMITPMIRYNFPESVWKKDGFGNFAKRDLTKDEVDKEMEMYEKGLNLGVIDATDLEDLNKIRETMGFEPREKPIASQDPFGESVSTGDDDDGSMDSGQQGQQDTSDGDGQPVGKDGDSKRDRTLQSGNGQSRPGGFKRLAGLLLRRNSGRA